MEIKPVKNYKKPIYAAAAVVAAGVISGCTTQLGGDVATTEERPDNLKTQNTGAVAETSEEQLRLEGETVELDGDVAIENTFVTAPPVVTEGTVPMTSEEEIALAGEAPAYADIISKNSALICDKFFEKNVKMFEAAENVCVGDTLLSAGFVSYDPNIVMIFSCECGKETDELFESRAAGGFAEKTDFGYIDNGADGAEECTVLYVNCAHGEEFSEEQVYGFISALEGKGIV